MNKKVLNLISLLEKFLHKSVILEDTEYEKVLDKTFKNPDSNRKIKVKSALNYDKNTRVYRKAKGIIDRYEKSKNSNITKSSGDNIVKTQSKNQRSEKGAPIKVGISKVCREYLDNKGLQDLTIYPNNGVDISQIKINPAIKNAADKDKMWVCQFPQIEKGQFNGKFTTAYTFKYKKIQSEKKFKRISKIKPSDIGKLRNVIEDKLNGIESKVSDAACIMGIIVATGQRPGTNDDAKNIGIRTLKMKNIKVRGDIIELSFLGKSSQKNYNKFKDAKLAKYLEEKQKVKDNDERVFDCSYKELDKFYKSNFKNFLIKDIRTYMGTQHAISFLKKNVPEITNDPKKDKKTIETILKEAFISTSNFLNNTPAMARDSYVHPMVINEFLSKLGYKPKRKNQERQTGDYTIHKENLKYKIMQQLNENKILDNFNFENIIENQRKNFGEFSEEQIEAIQELDVMNDNYDADAESFELPDWFENDDFELIK